MHDTLPLGKVKKSCLMEYKGYEVGELDYKIEVD